ncbi:MAG TPA: ATP-binding protein [Rhodocyclaceae bacterium]|nr:ATP-binding protein [Rhodocyclaceae bacterium]
MSAVGIPRLQPGKDVNKPQAQKRRIRLIADEHCRGAMVRADRVRVKQVLLNLLSNAIKYNPEKSSVQVSCYKHESAWHITVRDNGPGIPLDQQRKLFQPFSRLEATAQVEGTGIGLVLCKNLIERMGGQIGLISSPEHGSEFWFALPAHS